MTRRAVILIFQWVKMLSEGDDESVLITWKVKGLPTKVGQKLEHIKSL